MRSYVQASSILFALFALVHIFRLLMRWPLVIAGFPLPAFGSFIAVLITGGMAMWAWRALGSDKK
jgi:hypothetical protein